MNKEKRFGLHLHQDEKTALKKLAQLEGGLSLAATIRRLIRQAAKTAGIWPIKEGKAKNDS
ncbi:MAG: hypothetical protein FOGNACKC_03456 [Anaerolineae bacterium]|nr:hypothetical protein [Anaerolineae bacterium]